MTTKRKSQTDGADIVRALGFLVDAGHPLPAIALACEVQMLTVVKWFCGTTRPNYANFAKLRSVVSERYTRLLARHDIRTPRVAQEIDLFEKITDALMTDTERRADAELVERMTASLEAAQVADTPRFPKGTPEYERYAAELRVELDKFAHGEPSSAEGCTHSVSCPVHPTCDGGCPPAGQGKAYGHPAHYAGREGYRSVTRDVDPFELIAKSRKPEPHIPF